MGLQIKEIASITLQLLSKHKNNYVSQLRFQSSVNSESLNVGTSNYVYGIVWYKELSQSIYLFSSN